MTYGRSWASRLVTDNAGAGGGGGEGSIDHWQTLDALLVTSKFSGGVLVICKQQDDVLVKAKHVGAAGPWHGGRTVLISYCAQKPVQTLFGQSLHATHLLQSLLRSLFVTSLTSKSDSPWCTEFMQLLVTIAVHLVRSSLCIVFCAKLTAHFQPFSTRKMVKIFTFRSSAVFVQSPNHS